MNRRKQIPFFTVILVSIFFSIDPCSSQPAYGTYGWCDAWVSYDGQNWMNSTYENGLLHRGQPFYVKTKISTTTPNVFVNMNFFEVGVTKNQDATFEILDGYVTGIVDQNKHQTHVFGMIKSPIVYERIWTFKVRENATWWNGTTPLNIYVGFHKMTDEKNLNGRIGEDITFTVSIFFIKKSMYVESDFDEKSVHDEEILPDFIDRWENLFFTLPVFLLVCLIYFKKKHI